jgi:pSer/pThr/pTyr-binding forkhead associated (FHA) protein
VQNDIVLEDIEDMKTVSRYHATIEKSEKMGQWFVRDGQWRPNHDGEYTWQLSKNGVIVNGTRADYLGLPFYPDDIIAIGNTMLKVEYSPD